MEWQAPGVGRPSGRRRERVLRRLLGGPFLSGSLLLPAAVLALPAAASRPVADARPTLVRWTFRLTAPDARFRLEALDPESGAVLRTWWRDAAAGAPNRDRRLLAVADEGGEAGVRYRLWVRSSAGGEWLLGATSTGRRREVAQWELLGSQGLELISAPLSPAPASPLAIRRRAGSHPQQLEGIAGPAGRHGPDLGIAPGTPLPHLRPAGASRPAVVDVVPVPLPGADPPPPRRVT